jgi:hypothetical protein
MTKKKDEKFESTQHHEDSKAKIQAENRETAEDKEIADFKGLPQPGETRDQLLDRIRKMREEKPVEVEAPVHRSEALQKDFDLEQEAGRALVAKAEAQRERYLELLAKEEAEGEKNQG